MQPHGPWIIKKRHLVYRDPWTRVEQDDVLRPDGNPGTYCVVHIKPGVCVLAMDDTGQVYLTREFHYGVGRVTLECVSGGIEEGEQPLLAAQRELREELGIIAERWERLMTCDPFTANVVSPTEIFLAQGLMFTTPRPDAAEVIAMVSMPLQDAVAEMLQGSISHAPSCLAMLLVWSRLS